MRSPTMRDGFSVVELLVSLIVLSVAVLALATALGYLILQLRLADTRTERAMAVAQVQEQLRGEDFVDIGTISAAEADTVGNYVLWWELRYEDASLKRLKVFSEGPGISDDGLNMALQDSSSITIPNLP